MWRLNYMLLKNQRVSEEIKGEIKNKNTWRQMKMEIQQFKIYEMQQKQLQWEVYSDTGVPQETSKISNKQFNSTPKGTSKKKNK